MWRNLLEWGYTSKSSISNHFNGIFRYKPSSYWGASIDGKPPCSPRSAGNGACPRLRDQKTWDPRHPEQSTESTAASRFCFAQSMGLWFLRENPSSMDDLEATPALGNLHIFANSCVCGFVDPSGIGCKGFLGCSGGPSGRRPDHIQLESLILGTGIHEISGT